jgi:phage-related protein
MMDPPGITGAVVTGPSIGAVPNTADEDNRSSHRLDTQGGASMATLDNPKIRDLQSINKRLEEELQDMRDAFTTKDNSEHF